MDNNFCCVEYDFSGAAHTWINKIPQNCTKGSSMHCLFRWEILYCKLLFIFACYLKFSKCCVPLTWILWRETTALSGLTLCKVHFADDFGGSEVVLDLFLRYLKAFLPFIQKSSVFHIKEPSFFWKAKCLQAFNSETCTATPFTKVV